MGRLRVALLMHETGRGARFVPPRPEQSRSVGTERAVVHDISSAAGNHAHARRRHSALRVIFVSPSPHGEELFLFED